MLKAVQEKLGPGLIFAATAVGVSHLVQSTRAGATYGLSMLLLVLFVCAVKYPPFLFAARYTAATGKTIVEGYHNLGRWILYVFLFLQGFELLVALTGVSLVTAGIVKHVLGLASIADAHVALALVVLSIGMLALGKYALLENFTKVLVSVFCITTVAATIAAIAGWEAPALSAAAPLRFDRSTTLFLVAIAGWMPIGMVGAVTLSLWVDAKRKTLNRPLTVAETDFDFNLGYVATIFTALCFVVLGSYVLLGRGIEIVNDGAGFAAQLMSLFTDTLGGWAYLLVALCAFVVMYSSLLALTDAFPRVTTRVIERLWPNGRLLSNERRLFQGLTVVQLLVVFSMLMALSGSFAASVDMVNSLGFVVAPFVALFNHLAVYSRDVPAADQPGRLLRLWSMGTIVVLSVVALVYVYFKLTA
ncbi:MAG: Nramp family divalent metal transporter [Gammaproteobacteria bacterium]|nr:Nramp family divalent metal transporter [Gammaproteobacteria bacterium]